MGWLAGRGVYFTLLCFTRSAVGMDQLVRHFTRSSVVMDGD